MINDTAFRKSMRTSIKPNYAIFSWTALKQNYALYLTAYLTKSLIETALGIPSPNIRNAPDPDTGSIVNFSIGVVVAFILAMIATLIGANLIGPVATAVGGALNNKNLTGAANSLTAQVTLIFVTVVIVGVVTFLALFGGLAGAATKQA